MAACLAALLACCWSLVVHFLAINVDRVARARKTIPADLWAQKYLSDEVFMSIGVTVAVVWVVQYLSGRWRRSADWIDFMGRIVGAFWILIGLVWALREYY
jgi:hypothetical protein